MRFHTWCLALAFAGLGCNGGGAPADGPASRGVSPMPPGISEADFQALHQLTDAERPALNGTMVDLAGGKAYLSLPGGEPPFPGVVVIQEWWGLNDHVKHWADRLAADGFAALAVDLYDGKVATKPADAMAYMKAVDPDRATEILAAAHAFLGADARVRATRRGCIGWCFGGHWSLRHAINTPDLDCAVLYYGRLITDSEQLRRIQAPLCGIFGNEDRGIPPAAVDEWLQAMRASDAPIDVHRYPAPHAFANPSNARYDAKSAEDAWGRVRRFLTGHLKGE